MTDSDTEEAALRPANDNPWYCLATLYGEQPIDSFDHSLAGKNQHAWHLWFADIPDGQRQELVQEFNRRIDGRPLMPPDRSAHPDFSNMRFDRRAVFAGYRFDHPCDFRSARFCADADFSEVSFVDANFSSAIFSAQANFRSAHFNALADFQSATFLGPTKFIHANMARPNFSTATFDGDANFESTTFHGKSDFLSVKFSGAANFPKAHFVSAADFGLATFAKYASFAKATFADMAAFGEATFSGPINFVNAKFSGNTIFVDVRFERSVPDFRGATMHEATEWHGVVWPTPPSKKAAQRQVYLYERLKLEMERLKKHDDEQAFFRRELRARRGLVSIFSWSWLLNAIYQASSDYGNSFGKPLIWLFGVFAGGVSTFTHLPLCAGQTMPFKLATRLSFANILVFLPDKREILAMPEMASCLSNWTAAVSAIQSISGVVLLFLLGLVLRNRFRMK